MNWNEDALERLGKIPEEFRGFARQMVEQQAEEEGVETVTDEMIVNLRKKFEGKYGEQNKCPLFGGEENE